MKSKLLSDVLGIDNRQISAKYWQSGEEESSKLVCIFPGFSYSAEAPITFYLKLYFLEKGYDWLAFDYRYDENEKFLALSDHEQDEFFTTEQNCICEYIRKKFADREIVLVGKSLGTTALKIILSGSMLKKITKQLILLTPTSHAYDINRSIESESIKTLVLIGDKDPIFAQFIASNLYRNENVTSKSIENAGHLFEDKDSDLYRSIENLKTVITAVDEFLTK